MPDIQRLLAQIEAMPSPRRQATARLFAERGRELGIFPLAAAQRRLWFLSRLHADLPLYNVGYGFRIRGPLNVSVLRHSLDSLVQRHDALRTVFFEVDGEPFQAVMPEARLVTTVSRWRGQAGMVEEVVRRLLNTESRRLFDLSQAPLVRGTVVQLGEEDFLLLLTLHHIVCDGWSMTILLSDLTELYLAGVCDRPPRLPKLTCRYADYACWESAQEGSTAWERQLRYWTRQLAGRPQILELPSDHPRPLAQGWRGALHEFRWPAGFSTAFSTFCQQENVTPFVAAMAGLDAVLHQWTGQEDILVGVPVANRSRLEFESLVGVFINTVVLRARPTATTTFRELMLSVAETSMAALANQELPFEKLVEALAPERSHARPPVFQVCFAIQEPESIVLALPGLSTQYAQGDTGTAKFDVTLSLWPATDGLKGVCEYNSSLFEPATICRLTDDLRGLLSAAIEDPGRRLAELPVR